MSAAQKLIAAARDRARRVDTLSDFGVKMLREVLEYNDEQRNPQAKVSGAAVRASLKEHAGWQGGRDALDTVCREQLGRASFAKKGGAA